MELFTENLIQTYTIDQLLSGIVPSGVDNGSVSGGIVVGPRIIGGLIEGVELRIGSGNAIFKADENGIYLGNAVFASAPFRVNMSGTVTASDLTLTGGTIKYGKTSFTDSTNAGYWIGVSGIYFGAAADVSKLKYIIADGTLSFVGAAISNPVITAIQAGSEIAIQGWIHTLTFSVTDADTVAWSTGSIKLLDGTTYTISAGNTGNMSAETYIYLDIGTSTTVLQTTTTKTNAVGSGKILICVAQNGTDEASFVDFGSKNLNIPGTSIVTGSLTANEIAANTITANKLTISSLDAISANMGTITAGTITLDTSGYIRGGQTDYNTGTGFFLGYSGGAYKLSIGVSTGDYMTWSATALTIKGTVYFPNDYQVGTDTTLASADTARSVMGVIGYTKKKEITMNRTGNGINIYFELAGSDVGGHGRIYKNGTAVGTIRTVVEGSWEAYSENFAVAFNAGDKFQLYLDQTSYGDTTGGRNFRLRFLEPRYTIDLD